MKKLIATAALGLLVVSASGLQAANIGSGKTALSLAAFVSPQAPATWIGTLAADAPVVAREYGAPGTVWTPPVGPEIVRTTGVTRSSSQPWVAKFILSNGATWGGTAPLATHFSAYTPGCGAAGVTNIVVTGGLVAAQFTIPGACITTAPIEVAWLPAAGTTITDVNGRLGTGSIKIETQIWDATTNEQIDMPNQPSSTVFLGSEFAVEAMSFTATKARIDISTLPSPRTNFDKSSPTAEDTILIDKGASFVTENDAAGELLRPNGAFGYLPVPADCVKITVVGNSSAGGDFLGVKKIYYADGTAYSVVAADVTANSATFTIPADKADLAAPGSTGAVAALWMEIDGVEPLSPRTFSVSITLQTGGCPGSVANNLFDEELFTKWNYNGTLLIAPIVNANSQYFFSRFYITGIGGGDATNLLYRVTDASVDGTPTVLCDYALVPKPIDGSDDVPGNGSRVVKLDDLLTSSSCNLGMPYLGSELSGNVAVDFLVKLDFVNGVVSMYNPSALGQGNGFVPVNVVSYPLFVSKPQ